MLFEGKGVRGKGDFFAKKSPFPRDLFILP